MNVKDPNLSKTPEQPISPEDASGPHAQHQSDTLEPGKAISPQTPTQQAQHQERAHRAASDPAQYDADLASLNTPDNEEQYTAEPDKKSRGGSIIKELVIWAGITIAIVLIIQNFVFQAFYVSGSSMEPDYHNDDYLIISKLPLTSFDVGRLFGQKNINVARGDVLVFRYPNAPETFFIKRAIGLPGERVTVKNGVVTIYNTEHPEGLILKEDYIDPQFVTQGDIDQVVEQGKVFVMGDNRSPGGSYDSREWGQLPQGNITGFAVLRLLPVNSLKYFADPTYSGQ